MDLTEKILNEIFDGDSTFRVGEIERLSASRLSCEATDEDGNVVEMMFSADTDNSQWYDVLFMYNGDMSRDDSGSQAQDGSVFIGVLNAAMAMMRKFIDEYAPDRITFRTEDERKERIYTKLVTRTPGYKAYKKGHDFILTRVY